MKNTFTIRFLCLVVFWLLCSGAIAEDKTHQDTQGRLCLQMTCADCFPSITAQNVKNTSSARVFSITQNIKVPETSDT